MLVALAWLGASAGPLVSAVAVAAVSWGLAEFFTRRRRMALPSIILLAAFAAGCFFTGGSSGGGSSTVATSAGSVLGIFPGASSTSTV